MNHEEIRRIVREVLWEMFSPFADSKDNQLEEQWVNLKDAWKPLGYPSYTALYRAVQSGLLREGKEVCDRRKPGAMIARWQVDLIAARKRLRQHPARRRGGRPVITLHNILRRLKIVSQCNVFMIMLKMTLRTMSHQCCSSCYR